MCHGDACMRNDPMPPPAEPTSPRSTRLIPPTRSLFVPRCASACVPCVGTGAHEGISGSLGLRRSDCSSHKARKCHRSKAFIGGTPRPTSVHSCARRVRSPSSAAQRDDSRTSSRDRSGSRNISRERSGSVLTVLTRRAGESDEQPAGHSSGISSISAG